MTNSVFAIIDRKTHACEFVKEAPSAFLFERWFAFTFLRSDRSLFSIFPDDFDIYELCKFDSETMTVEAHHPPVLICGLDELFDKFHLTRPEIGHSGE